MGFRTGSKKIARESAVEQIHQEGKIVQSFNDAVYPAVFRFARPVVKTQNLAMHTTASSIKLGTILKVRTETDLDAVPYALQAYYGFGAHRHIGPRPYLDLIAKIALTNTSKQAVSKASQYVYPAQMYRQGIESLINKK